MPHGLQSTGAKSTIPLQIANVNDGVDLGVGILVRNVVAIKTIKKILPGVLLRCTDGGGWGYDGLVRFSWKQVS